MSTKTCSKCGAEKALSEFHKDKYIKCGYTSSCKNCREKYQILHRDEILNYQKQHYLENKEKIDLKHKVYSENNRHKIRNYQQQYYLDNKEKIDKRNKLYDEEHKEQRLIYIRGYQYNKLHTDLNHKLMSYMRNRIRSAIKKGAGSKAYKSIELLGCTIEDARKHLESLFQEGMTWENYGKWHIDHIRPCSSFDLTDPEQQKQCFNYKNIQPLWAIDNLRKSNKWDKNKGHQN